MTKVTCKQQTTVILSQCSPRDIYGQVEKGVSGIKHFYWVQPTYLLRRGTTHEKMKSIGIVSNENLKLMSLLLSEIVKTVIPTSRGHPHIRLDVRSVSGKLKAIARLIMKRNLSSYVADSRLSGHLA